MATLIAPVLSNFVVAPRVFGSIPFELTNPISSNTSTFSTYTFTTDISGLEVISISGRTVTILKSGNATITATQSASFGFSAGSISTIFTVNVATPTLSNFVIPQKFFSDISFTLTNPTSNSPGAVSFRSLTTDIVTVTGRVVNIKRVGRARIEAIKFPATNYGTASIIAEFDVLTSIVTVGVQNQIDLSWNRPTENGATIKNYFFYVEERVSNITPAPYINRIMETLSPTSIYYYSYALPQHYYAPFITPATGLPTGMDINAPNIFFNLTTSLATTEKNYIDLGYYCEVEISWVYHNDRPIQELSTAGAVTVMTLSLYKEASTTAGDNRVDLLRSVERTYDSTTNCLGPRPQNNNKTLTDIFNVSFDATTARNLKFLKTTDVISGRVKLSSITYSPASAPETTQEYSIIFKGIRIVPYRQQITRDFTSLGFGGGNADTGVGFSVSTVNAASPLATTGVLYHMPRMTSSMTDYNEAKMSFTWNYGANITRLTTDRALLPLNGGVITNLSIPFQLRIRCYSRPYARTTSAITVDQYNTTDVTRFLTNLHDSRYYTRSLFDVVLSTTATYAQIINGTSVTRTFDISGARGLPSFSGTGVDTSHTQFVFLFQLTMTDLSYNAYFQTITTEADAFRVKMLSQTFMPRQEYRFQGPDPTIQSSNAPTSLTNTLYNISDPYTNISPYYRFYNLTNGVFYSFRISSNNRFGTSSFSESFTRRCGSVPNQIVNTIDSNGRNTLIIESEKTTSQVNIYWEKPSFSGYDIKYFVIQMNIDPNGRWLTFIDYTKDQSYNTITFDTFEDVIVPVTDETLTKYEKIITTYKYKSSGASGALLNGSKYYFRLAGVNELGYSLYSSILTGIPFSRPENTPIEFYGNPIIGDQLIYISWKIPKDDAGSPILNYVIDYEEVVENIQGGVTISKKYVNKRRYKIDSSEPTRSSYPFTDFREVYTGYKHFEDLSISEQLRLSSLRSVLVNYVIPPTPITLNDADYNKSYTETPNRNVIMSYTDPSFSYISEELNQNVFDLSNIQLKWYYMPYSTSHTWPDDLTEVTFGISIRGHLKDISGNAANNIDDIFYIPDNSNNGVTYRVRQTMIDKSGGRYQYINFLTGEVISSTNVSAIPKVFVVIDPNKSRRIDSYNNKRYKLQVDFEMVNFSSSAYKFKLYSGPIILNGTAPIRTDANTNTRFTLKIENNALSPLFNDVKYRFEITPFNMNDFFPDSRNRIEQRIGTTVADPITDMSYSLVATNMGGKVILQWRYSAPSDYQINITIPDEYKDSNYPEEYKPLAQAGGVQSIFARNVRSNDGVVNYSIPSDDPDDINVGFVQKFLKSGRGYAITVAPVKRVEINGEEASLPADTRNLNLSDTYIVPFRIPLRPLTLTALGNNRFVLLKWRLPNIEDDPNYYKTVYPNPFKELPFYTYRFYSVEWRNVTAGETSWTVDTSNIVIPARSPAGFETTYTVTGLQNENNHQFRIRLMIINDYNNQRAFSDYTYMSSVNNIDVNGDNTTIYPSLYPYKPSRPSLRSAKRFETTIGSRLNGLAVTIDYPSYNGNADYYECYVEYTPPNGSSGSGSLWYDIFDSRSDIGIANISDNLTVLDVNQRLRTSLLSVSTSQRFVIICKANVDAYGIRVRVLGRKTSLAEPYPFFLYSDYSSEDYIEL